MRKSKENIKKLKQLWCLEGKLFLRLANEHRQFVQDLVMNLQALAVVLERHGYPASCYTCGDQMNSASFMVSLGDNHLIRFLVSDYGITWTEMRDDRELMKLEGAEAINQLEELATLVKQSMENVKNSEYSSPKAKVTLQNAVGSIKTHR